MDNLKVRERFTHVSLRIPESAKTSLERQAKRQHVNFNSLASKILVKGTSYDTIAEQLGAVTISRALFDVMLEDVPAARLEQLGKNLGPNLIKQTFTFLDLPYDLEGLIRYYFEPVSSYSGWYSFRLAGAGSNRKLMFQHAHGPKWSLFLKSYISSIIKAATGSEPRADVDDGLVTVYIS
jgi:hypothetical protein